MSDRHTVMLNIVLLIAGGLFAVGICAPLMTVQKWRVFTQTYTLGAGLLRLFAAKHYVLFLIVGTFSIAVPLVKMGLLALACNLPSWTPVRSPRLLHWLALCGKWSMLDVFLVAILLAVGTLRGIAAVEVQYGVYAFAAAMLLLHLVTCRLETLMQQRADANGLVEDEPAISKAQRTRKRSGEATS